MKSRFYFLSIVVTLVSLTASTYIGYDYFENHHTTTASLTNHKFLLIAAIDEHKVDKKMLEEAEPDLISPLEENIPPITHKKNHEKN